MRLFKKIDSSALFLIMEGIVYTMVLNLYNPFTQIFAKRMGGGDIHITMINSIPPLVAIFALLPGGILIERLNRKKKTVMLMLAAMSVFFASIALVPTIPHEAKVIVFVILLGLMNCPGSLYLSTWQSYFADNFEGSYASRVYTIRSKYSTFFGLITVLVTGLLLSSIPKSDEERLVLYQIFYGACFLLTLLQIFLFFKVKGRQESPAAVRKAEGKTGKGKIFSKEDFAGLFKNKPFLVFCLCGFVFHLSWQMGWPLIFIYNTDYANLGELQLSLINVASGLTQFLSFTLWNKVIDKRGSSFVIILGAAGLATNPFIYAARVGFAGILALNIFSGAFQAAFNIALFLCLLDTLPEDQKTVYISAFNTLTNLTGFIAPLIGLWIFNHTNMYMAMTIIGLFRVVGTMLYLIRWLKKKRQEVLKHC